MIATIEGIEILEEAEHLAKILAHSEVADEYIKSRRRMQADTEAQSLIAEFTSMKERYEEVQRFGKYHPDYTTVSTDIRVLKRKLDLHETIADFKKSEQELEKLLNEISSVIAGKVSKNIKVPTGNPFFDNLSCGGGCGSGGACGCG